MSIRRRIILFTILLLAALSGALIATSYAVINRITITQNTTAFSRELANIDFNIHQSHQDLTSAGLINLASYVEAEKKRLIDLIRGYIFGKTGQLFVLDSEGKIIVHPTIPSGQIFQTGFTGEIWDNQSGSAFYNQDGKHYFAIYRKATHWGWLLVMGMTEDELFETRNFYVLMSFVFCAVAFSFGGVFLFGFWRIVQKRIDYTLSYLQKMEQGNLDARLTVTANDEVGMIQQGINRMTERLQSMIAELSENRAKYYDLYENSPDCLMSVDIESGRIVECNSRVTETTGFPREAIVGRSISDMYDDAYRERAWASLKKLKKDGEVRGAEMKVKCADGSTIDVLLDAIGFADSEGELRYTRSSWKDISKRVKFEKDLREANQRLQELDRMKSMFIASVSHELRTPLNSIIGFSGLMLKGMSGELNDEQLDGLNRVNRAGKHLLALISDVIDISKIEAGETQPILERFSLEGVINEAIEAIRLQLESKHLTLEIDIPSWPKPLHTDRTRLLQCLLNYLSNALKFTEAGSITISVREEDDLIHISVIDTGIGIAKEDLPKLFTAFERLESSLRVKAGGTGLGLYLVKSIATSILGGDVSVESNLGEGSVFSLHIPKKIGASE